MKQAVEELVPTEPVQVNAESLTGGLFDGQQPSALKKSREGRIQTLPPAIYQPDTKATQAGKEHFKNY